MRGRGDDVTTATRPSRTRCRPGLASARRVRGRHLELVFQREEGKGRVGVVTTQGRLDGESWNSREKSPGSPHGRSVMVTCAFGWMWSRQGPTCAAGKQRPCEKEPLTGMARASGSTLAPTAVLRESWEQGGQGTERGDWQRDSHGVPSTDSTR